MGLAEILAARRWFRAGVAEPTDLAQIDRLAFMLNRFHLQFHSVREGRDWFNRDM